ncbi:hypothetical protein ACMS1Z_00270 [Acidiphilium multivorum]|uniref:hypothetical protein n=1 Tax=Acidiphilium multivorum TaxID=62140 RepID=UPI0039C96A48
MTPTSRVETTPHSAMREAIRAADALRVAAHRAVHEGRSKAAADMRILLDSLERTIAEELRRSPHTANEIGRAARPYCDFWPETRALPFQQVGRIPIDDLKFLFDLEAIPLPRTPENFGRLSQIRAKLEAPAHG